VPRKQSANEWLAEKAFCLVFTRKNGRTSDLKSARNVDGYIEMIFHPSTVSPSGCNSRRYWHRCRALQEML
jgi:hypothetical protein